MRLEIIPSFGWPQFLLTLVLPWTPVTGQCNGEPLELLSTDNDGTILSQNFPRSYGRGLDCAWVITAPSFDDRVTLSVLHTMLAPPGTDGLCQDYVRVYDGDSSIWDMIVEWCGTFNPETITSTSTSLYIEFHTDSDIQTLIADDGDYGFKIQYSMFSSGVVCPEGWDTLGPNCYQLKTERKSWRDAQLMCTYDAANLVSVEYPEEHDFTTEYMVDMEDTECVWVGLESFSSISRENMWIDGTNFSIDESVAYEWWSQSTSFLETYPLYACTAKCSSSGQWFRYDCNGELPYICKKNIFGTTLRHAIPPVADFTNGLEVVAIIAVAVLMTIFVGLILAFCAVRIKSCRQLSQQRKMSTSIQSYNAVTDTTANGDDADDDDDDDDDEVDETRALQTFPHSDPHRDEQLRNPSLKNRRECLLTVSGPTYEDNGTKPKRWLSIEFHKSDDEHRRPPRTALWSPGDYEMSNLEVKLNPKSVSPTVIEPLSSYDYSILVPEPSPSLNSERFTFGEEKQNNNFTKPRKKTRIFQV